MHSLKPLIDGIFKVYWAASPLFRSACRFWPTCSHYAHEAFFTHGWRRGGSLAIRRIVRCRPFGGHGFDPVP